MKVLITGGAGFIGSNLARTMLDQGVEEVRVIDDLSTGFIQNLDGLAVDFRAASILDYDVLREMTVGVDTVVHLAAIGSVPRSISSPRASHDANATGSLNVLEAAREVGVAHVVVASSSSVYGANPKLPKNENDWTRPLSPYGVTKQVTEGYSLAYQASYGMKTLAFRFFNVYGPRQSAGHPYAAVIPKFVAAALKGEPLEVHGDGAQSRDFTYVDTVCEVILDAVRRQVYEPGPVNLAFRTNTSLNELIEVLEKTLGQRLARRHLDPRAGDIKASQADAYRVQQLFPRVQPLPLEAGLMRTVRWYVEHGDLT